MYANQTSWAHNPWQLLVGPFITAFKAGGSMTTSSAAGAMWYRTILTTGGCAADSEGKPTNWQSAQDVVNYAVVLPSSANGMHIRVTSGGTVLNTISVGPGLNYGSVPGLRTGAQTVDLLNSDGSVAMTAISYIEVMADTSYVIGNICNYNYQVAALESA